MKTIKIYFSDFWKDFDAYNNFIYNDLSKRFHVLIDKNPDYLFYSCFGYKHLSYNSVKIFYSGENIFPDFNECDYAIGSYHLEFGDRYLRVPLSGRKFHLENIINKHTENQNLVNRKFCNFVYSNALNADPFRVRFLNKLSEYKTVDCGGKLFNNIGGPVEDKTSFLSNYKFTIAFENSSIAGYSTEKIVGPMSVNSMPIYWGDPFIEKDFNIESFIHIRDTSERELMNSIERIRGLDENDELYISMMIKPWLKGDQIIDYPKRISSFFDSIINKPLPFAMRRSKFGYLKQYHLVLESRLLHKEDTMCFYYLLRLFRKILKTLMSKRTYLKNG